MSPRISNIMMDKISDLVEWAFSLKIISLHSKYIPFTNTLVKYADALICPANILRFESSRIRVNSFQDELATDDYYSESPAIRPGRFIA